MAVILIAVFAFGNYQLQENTQEEFILDAGKFITPELAQHQIPYAESLFGEEIIFDMLNEKDVEGIRIYKTSKGVILVGTDADGNDMMERYLSFGAKEVGGRSMLIEDDLKPVAAL